MPKPNLAKLYGAAFGFNTDRRVKPAHFATGFFLALTGKNYKQRSLNYTIALPAKKEPEGKYRLADLSEHLSSQGMVGQAITPREVHLIRTHLQSVADNDDAVYAMFGKKAGFGSDYTVADPRMISRLKDNDGFSGQFVKSVLEQSAAGKKVICQVTQWISAAETVSGALLGPLLNEESDETDLSDQHTTKCGQLSEDLIKKLANDLSDETRALLRLCENGEFMPTESRLRLLVIGLGCWISAYLRRVASAAAEHPLILLCDMSNGDSHRLREQSRWSYTRFRETLVSSFSSLAELGRFEPCEEAWEWVAQNQDGRPKIEEYYRELLLRNGLAQPRGGRIAAKHFELQPDTLTALALSVLSKEDELVPLHEFLDRLFSVWGLCFGGRNLDDNMLVELGYTGLDQAGDLSPNTESLVTLLVDLGLATRYSDGLVMCHCEPNFSHQ
jgi:hypothetical protein